MLGNAAAVASFYCPYICYSSYSAMLNDVHDSQCAQCTLDALNIGSASQTGWRIWFGTHTARKTLTHTHNKNAACTTLAQNKVDILVTQHSNTPKYCKLQGDGVLTECILCGTPTTAGALLEYLPHDPAYSNQTPCGHAAQVCICPCSHAWYEQMPLTEP